MRRTTILALLLAATAFLCLTGLRRGFTQSAGLRRITNTTEEGLSLNPAISGDGRIVAFESTEDIAKVGGSDHFRAIRANIGVDPATFSQMAGTRAVAPAISQDGSRIAFASKDDPLGTNLDGNSEIFLFDGAKLIQVTKTSPGNLADRVTNGNFQPSISDDGRLIAFASNRNLAGQNADGNLEIFLYDLNAATFTQLTNSAGVVGCTDAKLSGDGQTVAFIRDAGFVPSAARDLLKQPNIASASPTVLAAGVQSLAMTYGRAISDDGSRVVYSAQTATNTTQVFLFDGRGGGTTRQITSLGARVTEVPLHPTISGDGSRIAFAARRSVSGAGSNSDGGVELYVYDLPTATFSKITNAPSSATADVVSSLSDDGSVVAFNFPRILSGAVTNSDSANNSEIYVTLPPARPANGTLTAILNDASHGHEPATFKAVAPDSIAFAQGTNLANTTVQSQRMPDGTFPTNVAGTRVTVNGRAAQICFVSPTQVNFLVPPQTEIGTAEVVVTNPENFPSRGTVPIMRAAPGIFTKSGDGLGEGLILNGDTQQDGPFDPSSGNLRLSIFATGARHAVQTLVSVGGRTLTPEPGVVSPDLPGLDEVRVRIPSDLRGAGAVTLSVISDGSGSNPVTVTFSGDPSRAIFVNEVLADPPDGVAGDANHDGVRDGTQDEFVELVNGSGGETIAVGEWTIKTRAANSTTETTRFTFPVGTSVSPGEALVVFGGGSANFNPNDPVFGCAQVFKVTSSSGLSLTNSGLTILVYNKAGNLITQFAYGGSTGLAGDNNQSLTRSPDITGGFVQHTAAMNANGRLFSPGLKTDGTPFGTCPGHLTTVTISPSTSNVTAGFTSQFTSQAFDEYGRVMTGVAINFTSDNTPVASVDSVSMNSSTGVATAIVTGHNQGTAHIQATATSSGTIVSSPLATLEVIPRVTRVEVSPTTATINRGNKQQFMATAFDQNNQPLANVNFNWTSSNTNVATIDSTGLAMGVGIGTVTVTASTPDGTGGTASNTATLNVQVPLAINEINADVPADNPATTAIEGDANRDGVRSAGDDEFVELLNNSNSSVDLSGVIVADATSNRFTFPASTILASGRAVVIFGGGNPPANDPAFGGALIVTASALSLNDSGDTVNVKLPIAGSDVLIATQAFGGSSGVVAPSDQSLTRSPDAEIGSNGGSFVAHNTATNAADRTFSPGTRADGTPFGSPPVTRIEVQPASARASIGGSQSFTAHAFNNSGGPEVEIQNVSFIWDSSDPTRATLAPATGQTTTASALSSGDTTIRARAGGQQGTALLSVNPALSINDVSLNEGDSGATTFTFTVSLSNPAPTGGVTFDIATQDGTATVAGNDYVGKSLTAQTIPAGSQTYMFKVTVNGDLTIEPDETFFVSVANVSGATVADGQGQGTIRNDDSPVLSINDVSANEGNSGTKTSTFTVSSSLPAPAGGITFDIATADNSAIAGSDYVARSLANQTITAGHTTYTFDVTVNGDTLVESNETFFVNVTNPTNASIGDGQGVGTIQNDDTANLVISQVYGGGNNSGAPFRNDFVELYNRGTTTVDFAVTPYSVQYASVGSNFGLSNTNLTNGSIAPGKYFLVQESGGTTNGVTLPTPDATGTIALASTSGKVALVASTDPLPASACPGDDGVAPFNAQTAVADFVGYGASSSTTGHCYEGSGPAIDPSNTTADFRKAGGCIDSGDNAADFFVASPNPRNSASQLGDCKPEIIINDVTVPEGNSGTVNANFTVSLTAASAQTVTVNFATADGTATAPADYQTNNGLLTFNPGDLTKTVAVLVNGDTLDENSETFFVNLSNAGNAVIIDGQGQGTISDNDPAPTLSINDVSAAEGDSGTTALNFSVNLSAASGKMITVDYATADNTATAPSDYQSTSGTLTFNPGDTTKTVTILVNGDTAFEQAETFFVNLTNPANATTSDAQGVGTINNDDAAPPTPTFFISDLPDIAEGDSGTSVATFTVTLSPTSAGTVKVDYATANGSATAGSDYQSTNGTLTFNPGDTSKPINVTINGDKLVEPAETFKVNLSNPTGGATVGTPQATGTIQNDDTPNLVISQVYGGGNNSGATFQRDFVEIFNRGTTTVDFTVTPYSVEYAGVGSNFGSSKTNLTTGSIAPGKYFLVQESGGTTNGSPLPPPDATGTISLGSTDGKVALIVGTAALATATCPGDDGVSPFNANDSSIADFVGYGDTSGTAGHCYEGPGPAAAPSNTTADFRKFGGCQDKTDNAGDFTVATPSPRNSSSPANDCSTADLSITKSDAPDPVFAGANVTYTITVTNNGPGDAQSVLVTDNLPGTLSFVSCSSTGGGSCGGSGNSRTVAFSSLVAGASATITLVATVNAAPGNSISNTAGVSAAASDPISGNNSANATTAVQAPPPQVSRVDVSPFTATINRGNTQQFTATAFDTNNQPIPGATFTWDSTSVAVATIDSSGLATGVGIGTTTITATTSGGVSGSASNTATLNVQVPLVINEILADPAGSASTDLAGDANRDGVRDGDDDEFVELLNDSNAAVDISGVIVADGTSNRFTFPASTSLAAGRAAVIFGGGNPPTSDPAFGGALIETTSSLSLNNTSDTVNVKLTVSGNDVLIATQTYGAEGGNDQSLTRSPDAEVGSTGGSFVLHNTATNAAGRIFSPGTRANGTPFGSPAITRIEVTPASVAKDIGETQTFTAKAFSNVGGPEIEVPNVCFIWDSSDVSKATVAPDTGQSTTATAVAPGSPAIRARAGGQQGTATFTINSPPPVLTSVTISPTTATIASGDSQQLTGQALDQFGQPIGGVTVTFSSNNMSIVTIDSTSPTSGTGSATCMAGGHATGSAEIKATATNGSTTVDSTPATLTVEPAAGQLLISEFRTRGPASASDEFIEIYNPTTSSLVIGGLKIRASNNAGTVSDRVTITTGTTLGSGCHYLVANSSASGYSGATPADQTYGTGVTDDGGIAITGSNGTRIIDAVGMSSGSAYKEGTTLTPLTGSADQSYERKPGGTSGNGTDSDNNSTDFMLNASSSNPQNSSSGCLDLSTADLAITKTDSPDPVINGSNVTYTIVVTNNGPGVAHSVVVSDNLPSNVTFVSCSSTGSGSCDGTGNSRTVTFSSLVSGASETITLVATANGPAGTPINNSASVSSSTTDPNSANNTAMATTDVINPITADLSIMKSDSPDPVMPAATLTYTLSVTNGGPDAAPSVVVTDNLPASVTFVDCASNQGGVCGGSATSPTVSFSSLANGATATITIHVTVGSALTSGTVITNNASVTSAAVDPTPSDNSDSEDTTVQEVSAGQLVISEFRTRGPTGTSDEFIELYNPTNSTVTIGGLKVIGSNGSGGTATRATITSGVMLGSGCHYLLAFHTSGCTNCYSGSVTADQTYSTSIADDGGIAITQADGTTIIDQVGMSAGSAYKEGTTLTPLANNVDQSYERKPGGSFGNATDTNDNSVDFFLNASSSNPQNFSTGCVNVNSADLSITKADSPDPVGANSNITYTISVTNNGPATATSLALSDSVPTNTTFVSLAAPGSWSCTAPSVGGTGAINCSVSSLALQTATFTLVVKVNAGVAGGTVISNTATIASNTTDPNSANNSVTQDTTVQPSADLSITKSDSSDPIASGANLTYTIMVSNNSVDAALTVAVTDNLPSDVTFVSCASTGVGSCGGTGNNRTVTFSSIAGNASETVTLVARVNHSAAGTTISNTASVASSGTADPNGANNSATQTTVISLPPLVISYIYGGGGATTGTPSYTRDFVEVFNKGTVAINLLGLSLQQGASTGNISSIYSLCPGGAGTCTLNPGHYYLIETGTTGTTGTALSTVVTPDDTGGIVSFAATSGKGALVTGTTALGCGATATPCSATALARVVDLVGYGTGTTQAEGNSPAGTLSTTTAARRKSSGCQDTNVNSADFEVVTPTGGNAPRNTSTAGNICP